MSWKKTSLYYLAFTFVCLSGFVLSNVASAASASGSSTTETSSQAATISLSAAASKEVEQDFVVLTLSKTWRGEDQKELTNKLNKAMQTVVDKSKGVEDVEVQTGRYDVWMEPQSEEAKKKKTAVVWQARAQMYVKSAQLQKASDFVRSVSDAMTLDGIEFQLSDKKRQKVESELREQAIAEFRKKAAATGKSFGYEQTKIAHVEIKDSEYSPGPRVHATAMRAAYMASESDQSVPLESGTTKVTVTVSGDVFVN